MSSTAATATPVFKRRTREFLVVPVPRWLQYDPEQPFHFGLLLNLFFGFASTMVVCNLYYCQPLLLQLAASFGVDNTRVANVPTLTQAGYASGILLLSPLGDLVRRRPLLLALVACSTLLTLGLARAPNLEAFSALTFLIGLASVTPQVLIPLAADLAAPPRRAQAVAIVFSGILLGLMVARVLAGIIAQYTGPGFDGWRNVYWMAFGVQALTLVMLYLSLPDWPTKNKGTGLTYWGIMKTMARLAFTEPLLIQCSLIAFLSFSVFASFWVTLTFLLGGEPYHYSTLQIGLFGLIGALGVLTAPLVGRLIDRLRSPWYATLASVATLLVFAGIMEGAGGVSVGAVVVVVFGLDVGFQLQQISNATRIYSYVSFLRLFSRALAAVCVPCSPSRWRACSCFWPPVLGSAHGRLDEDDAGARLSDARSCARLSEEEVRAMEAEVEGKRKGGRSARTSGLSDDVLDECEKSFIAAQEGITKASKNYYSDTGLMAILCRHDRVLWVANMTSAGEKQYYALALLDRVMRDLPLDWRVGVLYDIACQLSRSIERFRYLEQYAPRLSFAVSVFHAYGHQWSCQLVYHPRKRSGFGLTDGEGCERFWSAIRRLIAVLRVCGFFRRLFVLDRQFDFIDQEGLKKSGKWLARRWRNCMKRLHSAQATLKTLRYDEDALEKEWKDQVQSQLVKPQRQSKSAGDKAINEILLDMGRASEAAALVKRSEAKLRKTAHRMRPSDLQALTDSIDSGKREVKAIKSRIKAAAGALGTESARQLRAMRGDDYVCARVNARALRANIREAVRAHKFERERLERAYRRQVMQHKDHAQTRDLVHKKQKTISSMVTRYNALVKKMEVLVAQGRVPTRRTRAPRRLDAKELFKLDVDDEIWQEDPGLGPQDEGNLPRWQVDSDVRIGIPAMLEARRCREELERLDAEAQSLAHWWAEERNLLAGIKLEGPYDAEVQARVEALTGLGWTWTRDLAAAGFSVSFDGSSQFTRGLAIPPMPKLPSKSNQEPPAGSGEQSDNDDDSAILSEEEEDEPVADHLDDVADAASDAHTDDDDADADGEGSQGSDGAVSLADLHVGFKRDAGAPREHDDDDDALHEGAGPSRAHAKRAYGTRVAAGNGAQDNARERAAKKPRNGSAGTVTAKREPAAHTASNVRASSGSRQRRAFSPSAISISSNTDSDNSDGTGERGRTCGPYVCSGEEVLRFVHRTDLVSGDGLAVLSESFLQAANRNQIGVVPSTVFRDLKEHHIATKANDTLTANKIKSTISKKLRIARMPHPADATKWLVVVHIEMPKHWVLLEIRWRAKVVKFYDSFAMEDGYAKKVAKYAFRFLELCGELFEQVYKREDWSWVGEERPLRQTNGYDCGPFIMADLETLLASDTPSSKTQSDMRAWRASLAQRLRSLPQESRDKASVRVATSLALARGAEVFNVDSD